MPTVCGAWLEVPTAQGRRKDCTLRAGHYLEDGPGGKSWHTNCPERRGMETPEIPRTEASVAHAEAHRHCTIWADWANGAHKASESPVTGSMGEITSDEVTSETVGTAIFGVVRADVQVGDTTMSVSGTARFVGRMISEFGEGLIEEAER